MRVIGYRINADDGAAAADDDAAAGDDAAAQSLTFFVDKIADGTTIEITTEEAWLVTGVARTAIIVADGGRRRLAGGDDEETANGGGGGERRMLGKCLANGACLYSRSELLELRTTRRARRALSADDDDGGYFDAHADVATFDLSADGIIERWRATGEAVYGEGGDDEVPELAIRFAWSKRFKAAYVLNETNGAGTLRTRNGTYEFDRSGVLATCTIAEMGRKNWFEDFAELLSNVEVRNGVSSHNDIVS